MVSTLNDAEKGSWYGARLWAFGLASWALEGQCKSTLVSSLKSLGN